MKDKHKHHHANFRKLWSSSRNAFEGSIAGSPYHWKNDNKNDAGAAPSSHQNLNNQDDVSSGIVAGDNPGGFSWHYEPRGQAPIVKGDHLPFVIPTEGGIF